MTIFIPTAVPATLASDANHLAMAHGQSLADGETWTHPMWQDAAGNLYVLRQLWAPDWWIHRVATLEPARPAWDTGEAIDLAAAERARAALDVLTYDPEADPASYLARPDRTVAILSGGPELFGLVMVEGDNA